MPWATASTSAGSTRRSGRSRSGAAMTIFLIVVTTRRRHRPQHPRRGRPAQPLPRCCGRRSAAYVELIRNTPFLVQLFFIFFGLPALGIRLDPIVAAMLAMTLNMAAYTTEIVGAGLDAVPQRPARGSAGARAAAAAGVRQDRAAAGAEGDLSRR